MNALLERVAALRILNKNHIDVILAESAGTHLGDKIVQ
jgi:hypothetical protein